MREGDNMKVAVSVGSFVVIACLVNIACPQLGQSERGAQDALRGLALIDDTRPSVRHPPATGAARFTITLVHEEAILLDTATGETWHLVFVGSGTEKQLRWEPVPRK